MGLLMRLLIFCSLQRAREVYTQKIVLATAMKELQFRVSDVLNEEDVSLGDLDKVLLFI